MGLGRDDTLKIKVEKLDALAVWNTHETVWLFIFHSSRDEWLLIPYPAVRRLALKVKREGGVLKFPDGHPYLPLKYQDLVALKGTQRGEWRG